MKNPLYRRLPRELKKNIGKYLALFLFLTVTIGFCSGFFVAGGSMKQAYEDSFEKYNIEDGHFTLYSEATDELKDALKAEDITISELFYKERTISNERVLRIYKLRNDVNKVDVMSGRLPEKSDEIALDRLFCKNNSLSIGDSINIDGRDVKITGIAALSDYSALYRNNSDFMLDSISFSVALVTDDGFDELGDLDLHYNYAWLDGKTTPENKQAERAEEIQKIISKYGILTDYLPQFLNQAIKFAGNDVGRDRIMVQWLLYIIIAVIGFAAAITTRSTVEQEAAVIGTLRATGFKRTELLRHYIVIPLITAAAAAIVGNILGYTVMKEVAASMYYNSYSFPTLVTVWNADAFLLTTVIPLLLIFVINLFVLGRMLRLPPLQFLRHELKKKKKNRSVKLSFGRFFTRFRLRIIIQNIPAYILLFIGIFVANVMLMFGLALSPMVDNFAQTVIDTKISDYQYILKAPYETKNEAAEKFAITELQNEREESISIYGISENSKYVKKSDLKNGKVLVSDSYRDKYGIKTGDKLKLSEKYRDKTYELEVSGVYSYPGALCVFMDLSDYHTLFEQDDDFYSGYFSNEEITDIDERYIATVITVTELTAGANQLKDSMGMVALFGVFAMALYVLMIFILAKMVTEKNTKSISVLKIIGYSNREIGSLYNYSTGIVVILSMLISIPLQTFIFEKIYYMMMREFNGWITFYIAPWVYPVMIVCGCISFLIAYSLEMRRIKKIPKSEAIKGIE